MRFTRQRFTLAFAALFLAGSALAWSAESTGARKAVPSEPVAADIAVEAQILEASITRGVDFLLKNQNENGSWGGATRTKKLNIYAPFAGAHQAFRAASTSLAVAGLVHAKDERAEVKASIDRAEEWLVQHLPRLHRGEGSSLYLNWANAYGLRALVALSERDGVTAEKRAQYKAIAENQVRTLWINQDLDGGWGYYGKESITAQPSGGSMSFTTATVLLAMKEASETFGLEYDPKRIKRAVGSIQLQRTPDFAYVYALEHIERPRHEINRPAGSLARTPACNAALYAYGDEQVTHKVITEGLDRLVKRNGWLDIGRKRPKPHETHFSISGYFYFYGHYYATENMLQLPLDQQQQWKSKLARIMLDKQESDGSWWDFPLYNYGQYYGTGYALTTLARCR